MLDPYEFASQTLERDLPVNTGVVPTELYCKNRQVDSKNNEELARLPGPVEVSQKVEGGQEFPRNQLKNEGVYWVSLHMISRFLTHDAF